MSGSTPVVSVVIPAFNRAHVIERAIHSALGQTLEDVEVLVVDDASTDQTRSVVESVNDERVRYFRHETNRFAAAARNTAMAQARGRFIAFLDSDDEWHPSKLELQVTALDKLPAEWGAIYSGANLYKDGSAEPQASPALYSGDVLKAYVTSKFVIWTPTFLFRRSCLEHIEPMDEQLIRSQDRDFFIRLLEQYKLAAVCEPLANIYLETSKSLSDVALQSRKALLLKHGSLLDELGVSVRRQANAIQWMMQAEQYLLEGKLGLGARFFLRAVCTWPFLPPRRFAAAAYKFVRGALTRRRPDTELM